MKRIGSADQYMMTRESNVVRVDFARAPNLPAPQFPGAGALRNHRQRSGGADGCRADRAEMRQWLGLKATSSKVLKVVLAVWIPQGPNI